MTLYSYFASPLGKLLLISDGMALTGLELPNQKYGQGILSKWILDESNVVFIKTRQQLDEYFAGKRKIFDLALAPTGTAFQKMVWQGLMEIPYGNTMPYSSLAMRIGAPDSARAVGHANGRNPIAIIIPCHRLVGKNGSLTGYGGGIEIKAALINFERVVSTQGPEDFRLP